MFATRRRLRPLVLSLSRERRQDDGFLLGTAHQHAALGTLQLDDTAPTKGMNEEK